MKTKRVLSGMLLGFAIAMAAPSVIQAEMLENELPARTKDGIIGRWKMANPDNYKAEPFIRKPNLSEPFEPGVVNSHYLQGGVARANFYRYISGLPDLELSPDLTEHSQYVAAVTASVYGNYNMLRKDYFKPGEELFEKAQSMAKRSNMIKLDDQYANHSNQVSAAVDKFMNPLNYEDIKTAGDSRGLLIPELKKIGLGFARGDKDTSYTILHIPDTGTAGNTESLKYSYISYPANGSFPLDVFDPKRLWNWKIMLNPQQFKEQKNEDIKIRVQRQSDRRTWSTGDLSGSAVSHSAALNQISFHLSELDSIQDDDVYTVKVSGLKKNSYFDAELEYKVHFFYINKPVSEPKIGPKTDTAAPLNGVGNKPQPPVDPPVNEPVKKPVTAVKFSDLSGHWSEATVQWAIDNRIVNGYQDGKFQPDKPVSEEEFLSLLLKAYGQAEESPSGERWSDGLYAFAASRKYPVKGAAETAERSAPITRTTAAEIIAAADGAALSGHDAIQYLLSKAYARGRTDAADGFAGTEPLSRAESLQLIRNLKEQGMNALK